MEDDFQFFENMVAKLAKPGENILEELTPDKAHLLHMAMGIAGEAGELLDAVKKHVIYNKPIDRGNIVEELGDLRFYMKGIMLPLEVTELEVIKGNIGKLSQRYKDFEYSNQAAQDRADKAGQE